MHKHCLLIVLLLLLLLLLRLVVVSGAVGKLLYPIGQLEARGEEEALCNGWKQEGRPRKAGLLLDKKQA